jgi:ferritin-like metal-binding protein YciE
MVVNNPIMRYTLSSLLNRLIEGERVLREAFIKLSAIVEDIEIRKYLENNIKETDKRIEELEWIKGFIVIEMTLEPILGPDLKEYVNKIVQYIGEAKIKEDFVKIEKLRIDTYRKAIELLKNVSPEASDLLESFITRSEELLLTL